MKSAYVELKIERVYAPAARLKTAQDQLAALQNETTDAHGTTWTVCQEHHAPARDVCGKAKVIGFSWDHTFTLLGLFKHMYAGDPAADVDRANRVMADLYAKWTPITVKEWFVFKGLVIAGGLCAAQVRTPATRVVASL